MILVSIFLDVVVRGIGVRNAHNFQINRDVDPLMVVEDMEGKSFEHLRLTNIFYGFIRFYISISIATVLLVAEEEVPVVEEEDL